METIFFDTNLFTFVILPLLIFIARIMDVTIGTLRIVFIAKGHKIIAPLLGFFEVLIWIFAVGKIMQNLDNPVCYLSYAGGFAMGNYVGLKLEEKLAIGFEVVRIITQKGADELINVLQSEGYGITSVKARGKSGTVHLIFMIIRRSHIKDIIARIQSYNPNAFYTIEDARMVHSGVFPVQVTKTSKYRRWRRGK
ncbi:MAG: DUF2179 domain-containing protein [Bacteroidales bacterium]|nr:MAG: DUF2179 domain-containing protein [Bacteroidales bacterium]